MINENIKACTKCGTLYMRNIVKVVRYINDELYCICPVCQHEQEYEDC